MWGEINEDWGAWWVNEDWLINRQNEKRIVHVMYPMGRR